MMSNLILADSACRRPHATQSTSEKGRVGLMMHFDIFSNLKLGQKNTYHHYHTYVRCHLKI